MTKKTVKCCRQKISLLLLAKNKIDKFYTIFCELMLSMQLNYWLYALTVYSQVLYLRLYAACLSLSIITSVVS